MKILAIADRDPKINIPVVVNECGIDLVVTLGDLIREDILGLSTVNNIPKIGIYGNHDSGTYMPELGIWDMHLKVWDFNGLKFGGLQGCVRYKPNPAAIMYTQNEAIKMMENFPAVDVFISHCPPRGINDEEEIAHQGYDALRSYLEQHKPKLWIHGHTYPTAENIVTRFVDTNIEYVYKYKVINI